jgi:TIR domain
MLAGATEPAIPTEPKKPLIVISHAYADDPGHPAEEEVKWLSFLTRCLGPAIKESAVDLWIDRLMPRGAYWEREIEQKLRACDIFILLVSRRSLSSGYVVDQEIAIIRVRQVSGEPSASVRSCSRRRRRWHSILCGTRISAHVMSARSRRERGRR